LASPGRPTDRPATYSWPAQAFRSHASRSTRPSACVDRGYSDSGRGPGSHDDIADRTATGEDGELAQWLDGIVDEVQRLAAASRFAVMLEFAGKIGHACRSMPRHQLAGAIATLKQARRAALTQIANDAKAEIEIRRAVVIRAHGKPPRLVKPALPASKPASG